MQVPLSRVSRVRNAWSPVGLVKRISPLAEGEEVVAEGRVRKLVAARNVQTGAGYVRLTTRRITIVLDAGIRGNDFVEIPAGGLVSVTRGGGELKLSFSTEEGASHITLIFLSQPRPWGPRPSWWRIVKPLLLPDSGAAAAWLPLLQEFATRAR